MPPKKREVRRVHGAASGLPFFFDRIIAFLMTVVDNGVRKEVKFGADV